MKKEEELKLRGAALDARMIYHQKWSNWFGFPFLAGLIALGGGVALVFVNRPNRLFWGLFALGGFLVGALSMLLGAWHSYRVEDLRVLMREQPGAKSVDPKVARSALDLIRKDEALDDNMFTPPAALRPGASSSGPGLTDEGWEDLKEGW